MADHHAVKDDHYPSEKNDFDNEKAIHPDGDVPLEEEQENSPIDAVRAGKPFYSTMARVDWFFTSTVYISL
jgi:hypothetical protein